jgi:hypothetical protein
LYAASPHEVRAGNCTEERWSAYLTIRGVRTDRDCSHLHHTVELAEKCGPKAVSAFARFWGEASVEETVIKDNLVEWRTLDTGRMIRFRAL